VGFTRSTEHMPARELVKILHDYFTDFDHIARRYRLEKLKTIGDSYMCVGGLPAPNASHPVDAVLAALEMLESVRGRTVS
jgi:adenylate cyclase